MPGFPNPGRLCGASAPAGKCRREEGPGFFVGSIRAFQQSGQTAQNETTDEHSPAQPQPKNLTTKTRRREDAKTRRIAKFLVAAMPRQAYPRSSVVSLCAVYAAGSVRSQDDAENRFYCPVSSTISSCSGT